MVINLTKLRVEQTSKLSQHFTSEKLTSWRLVFLTASPCILSILSDTNIMTGLFFIWLSHPKYYVSNSVICLIRCVGMYQYVLHSEWRKSGPRDTRLFMDCMMLKDQVEGSWILGVPFCQAHLINAWRVCKYRAEFKAPLEVSLSYRKRLHQNWRMATWAEMAGVLLTAVADRMCWGKKCEK